MVDFVINRATQAELKRPHTGAAGGQRRAAAREDQVKRQA
jgi:hypothetical protein